VIRFIRARIEVLLRGKAETKMFLLRFDLERGADVPGGQRGSGCFHDVIELLPAQRQSFMFDPEKMRANFQKLADKFFAGHGIVRMKDIRLGMASDLDRVIDGVFRDHIFIFRGCSKPPAQIRVGKAAPPGCVILEVSSLRD
jgi:hypothetical protein